ncbi:(2Fe-2S) ferredoxin [Hyphomicrobiales bacterium]|nr:(2Fe-2S) ferredoxin [Hyphomicrobiales bacterium]CAH1694895.1 (2Fe-2S) ferredoxin [Hyphomicrobiales bacterium]
MSAPMSTPMSMPMSTRVSSPSHRIAAVLLARSAIAAAPHAELAEHVARLRQTRLAGGVEDISYAFTEQGTPSLREEICRLREAGYGELWLMPLFLPAEPSLRAWLLRVIQRWADEEPAGWPLIRVGPLPGDLPSFGAWLEEGLIAAGAAPPVPPRVKKVAEGSVVPAYARRILLCQGGPCNNAGSAALWGHLRNAQARLDLRNVAGGTMSAKTTCLGPCNLAPVMQVYPEGSYYCGVNEVMLDRIIEEHILGGEPVGDLVYEPSRQKQYLR